VTAVFCDTSVLIRYFAEDDIPRAAAAAALIDSDATLVISTGVVLETIHVLRTDYAVANPVLAAMLVALLSRANVQVTDADKSGLIAAIYWTQSVSSRRIMDAIIATAAEQAKVDFIATFDAKMRSPIVPVRML